MPCPPSKCAHLVGDDLQLALASGGIGGQERIDESKELLHDGILSHVVVAALHQLPENAALAVVHLRTYIYSATPRPKNYCGVVLANPRALCLVPRCESSEPKIQG